MEYKIMKTKLIVGKSVSCLVTKSISINIDNPLWQVTRYEKPLFIYSLAYEKIRIPVWKMVTLEIYDELEYNP
jgi:hypothetical protein